jgi:hypothetical protein
MNDDEISSIRLRVRTKERLEEERHGRESDDILVNRLLDELQKLRAPAEKITKKKR